MLRDWAVARTFNASTWLTMGVWSLVAFGYFGLQGVLLNLYLLRLGFGLEFIGLLNGAGQLTWAVAALPAGALGRRFRLRPMLIAASCLMTLGIALFVLVERLPQVWWPVWLFGTWMILWFGAALLAVNNTAYVMQMATPEQRNYAFSAQSAVMVLFGFLGSVVAGLLPGWLGAQFGASLNQPEPYRWALMLTPFMYLAGTWLWARTEPAPPLEESESGGVVMRPMGLFLFFAVVAVLQAASDGAVRAFFNVYLDAGLHVPLERIGTIFGVGQLVPLAAVVSTPGLMRRWGSTRTFALSSAAGGLALLPLAGWMHWGPATLGFVGMMTTSAVAATARTVMSQEMVAPQWRTTTAAISVIGLALGWSLTAGAGGYVIELIGYPGLFFLSAGLAFAAAALLFGYLRAGERRAT